MKKKDLKYLIIFIILILLIILFLIYNDYKERNLNVDRKIKAIYKNYSYDIALKEGKNLFNNALNIFYKDIHNFAKDNNKIILYNIYGFDEYKKLINIDLIIKPLLIKKLLNF